METIDIKDFDIIVRFTVDEEVEIATWIMRILSKRSIQGSAANLAYKIYQRKCSTGYDIVSSELIELIDLMIPYTSEDVPLPLLRGDGRHMVLPTRKGNKTLTSEESFKTYRKDIVIIWRDVWAANAILKTIDDEYKIFPGNTLLKEYLHDDDINSKEYYLEQKRLENTFWQEVERIQKETGCSRKDCIVFVSDYTRRGDVEALKKNP